jgi:hypothetical protein
LRGGRPEEARSEEARSELEELEGVEGRSVERGELDDDLDELGELDELDELDEMVTQEVLSGRLWSHRPARRGHEDLDVRGARLHRDHQVGQ